FLRDHFLVYFRDQDQRQLEFKSWRLRALREGLQKYIDAIDHALERAKKIDDKDIKDLLELTGVGFAPIVEQVKPQLMRFDVTKGRWVPDEIARGWVGEIESRAEILKAQKRISEAEAQVVILALGLVPIFAPESLVLRMWFNGILAADVAVNTVPDYIRQDSELKTALGASGVIGTERLNVAEAEKTSE